MKKVQQLFNSARTGLFGKRTLKDSPIDLAARAGKTAGAGDSSMMEQLEKREYLFVLTVDQNDPSFQPDLNRPHYGTVTANFAYFLPFLQSQLPAIEAAAFPAGGIGDPASPGPGVVLVGPAPRTLDVDVAVLRNRMAEWLEDRMAGVSMSLYGRFEDDPATPEVELPTSLQVFDLYGRDMQQRLDIGRPSPFDQRLDGALPGTVDLGLDPGRPAFPADVPNPGDPAVDEILPTQHNEVSVDDLEATGDRGDLAGTLTPFSNTGIAPNIGDGVPDMNDGLGLIVLIQSDALTRVNMLGGQVVRVIDQSTFDEIDVGFDDVSFYGINVPDNEGDGEWWDEQGFGFDISPDESIGITGLPEIGGSIVFGAPFIRDNTDDFSYFGVTNNVPGDAVNSSRAAFPDELVFSNLPLVSGPLTIDGVTINTPIVGIRTLRSEQAVGEINVPGLMMGTVNVSGSLGLFYTQHMFGSMNVTGDVGQIYVGGTMGYWIAEDQRGTPDFLDGMNATNSTINVGGRVGQIFVAGRNRANIFITGDIVNPRLRIEGSTYSEVETVFGINPNLPAEVLAGALNGGVIRAGMGTYRNDGFSTAEFIFSGLGGTTINGSLGLMDPLNEEDLADFYAFAANGGAAVQLNVTFPSPLAAQNAGQAYVRVYDQNGNLIATHQGAGASPGDTTNPTQPRTGVNFQFNAPATGVYYLVVGTPADGQFGSSLAYTVTMSGQAATTLGQLATGGGIVDTTLVVTSGAVGRVSGGQFVIAGDGSPLRPESDATLIPDADYIDSFGFTLNVPSLYNFVVGGDVGSGSITSTGVIGGVQIAGGVMSMSVIAARQLATFDVGGQVGVQEETNLSRNAGQTAGSPAAVFIRTGGPGVVGHIGRIRSGDIVRGDQFTVQTSEDSRIDLMEIGGGFTTRQPTFILGQGSDIRFASFPTIDIQNPGQQVLQDFFLPITTASPLTFTDDSGVTFTVRVTGIGSVASLRYAPAGAFGGGVVGQIVAVLGNTGNLIITTTSAGVLSLGDITVIGGNAQSQVQFTGPAEIDVRSLQVNGAINAITNTTPDGDLLSVDVGGVRRITANGSIGSTQNYMLGLRDIALNVNLVDGLVGAVGGGLGVPNGLINAWQGGANVPYVFATADADERTLEDSGSPIDEVLNGVVIRGGNVDMVSARGSVGDVITQGGAGARVTSIIANSDGVNTTLGFEGIVGSIFVGELTTLDVGDGILGPGPSPLARAGVFAIDDIMTINAGTRVLNPILTGVVIVAGNSDAAERDAQGIQNINIRGADLDRSFVHVANLDSWWRSARYGGDDVAPSGTIANVRVTNGDITRTDFHAVNVGTIQITGGRWDATSVQVEESIGTISADGFMSSLSNIDPLQYYFNQIRAGFDVGTVRVTNSSVGDIEDLFVSAGRNNTSIQARNLIRSNFDLRGNAGTITIRGDVRASSIGSGRLQSMAVSGDIRNSTVRISGAILSLTAGGDITDTEIISSGPDGRINTLTAGGTMTGTVTSSGPIGTIRTTRGDINLLITTTQLAGAIGNINTVQAGRDLILDLDLVDGTSVGTLRATRHIGRRLLDGSTPDTIDVPGNIATINAGGVLYSDVRASGTLGTVTMGRALAYLPTGDYVTDAVITASARINTVTINGDFDGSIVSYSGGIGTVTINNGSFRAGTAERPNRIEARDGDITNVRVVNGHLLGDVLAPQGSINAISVTGTGVFGNIGINPDLSTATQTTPMSERRTQLPQGAVPTAGRDGPTISAGVNIGTITAAGGVFESTISAGRLITTITVSRGIDNAVALASADDSTVIIAGDRINTLNVTQQARGTFVAAGVTSLGDDAQPGGTADNADTVKSGTIGTLNFRGGTSGVMVAAGLVAGVDGLYNTADDNSAPGISTITSVQVTGTAVTTVVRADSGTPSVSANLLAGSNSVGGQALPVAEGFAYDAAIPGVNVPVTSTGRIFTIGGQLRRVVFTGTGTAVYSATLNAGAGLGTLVLTGTTTGTIRIEAAPAGSVSIGTLRGIVGRDDASLGTLMETVDVSGLTVMLDGQINTVTTRNLTNSPIRTGQRLGNVTSGVAGGTTNLIIESRGSIGNVRTLGGLSNGVAAASVQGLTVGTVNIAGAMQGTISSDRDITSLAVTGQMALNSGVRAGYNIGAVTIGSMDTAVVAAGGNIANIRVNGNVLDSAIVSGVDLGRDAAFGGTDEDTDVVSNGNMGTVNISGSFSRSDISAGAYQGEDGFLGTADDNLGEGRSSMGNVTITGSATGSVLNNQRYRIISNGTIGTVRALNQPFVSAQNLAVVGVKAQPDPLEILGVGITFVGGTYFATIGFNQPVDPATIEDALEIRYIRNDGTPQALVSGGDYTVTYVAGTNSAVIEFDADLINQSHDVIADVATDSLNPGPGLFRFDVDSSVIRGQTSVTRLDGDGDGVAELNDDWRRYAVVGDAGDRLETSFGVNPGDLSNVDFYAPTNLDLLLAEPFTGTSIVNRTFALQGVIGDHQDLDPAFFGAGSDLDIYTLTLQQGQILSMAVASGGAAPSLFSLGDQGGRPILDNPAVQVLPDGRVLVLETGTFAIVVAAVALDAFLQPGNFGNPQIISGGDGTIDQSDLLNAPANAATGNYVLAVRVADDGDNGFNGGGSSGNGSNVETAPLPAAFAGVDGVLGTQDDLASITVGDYVYQLDPGANNVLNGNGTGNTPATRSDDRVVGANVLGTEQVRTAGGDGVFGTADDVTTINDAIGERNAVGGAVVNASDVDVFQLNAGATITAGQRYRFTLRTNEYGGDLGSLHTPRPLPGGAGAVGVPGADTRGEVQFALFEVDPANGMLNSTLVAQGSNPEGYRATPNTIVASDGFTTHGYDANGDYYMELTIPPSQADGTVDGSFALYVQGLHQSRYSVEIVRLADGPPAEAQSQNFLIETNGGLVDWLNPYTSTTLTRFSGTIQAAVPGLGMTTREYILSNLIANLNDFFATVGVDITISTTSADFVGQDFSTVFVTDSLEPADQFNQGFFGASERRDVLNADRNDQAVVFAPSVTTLGIVPDQAGTDAYVRALTAAVAQRMGELLGLSFANGGAMTDGIPAGAGGLELGDLDYNDTSVRLGQTLRSDFIMGFQNDTQLLRRIFQLTT